VTRIFRNARIPAGGDGTRLADFAVTNGRFAWFDLPGLREEGGAAGMDLGGALVLPGVMDGHVHFDDPGYTWRETFTTGTRAAAAGGVTCVADMPCTSVPPVVSVDALALKLEVISPQAHVDFMCWGGICASLMEGGGDWCAELHELADAGAAAVKGYLLSGMESFPALSPAQLLDAAATCRDAGLPLGVHAEDRDLVLARTAELRAAGRGDPLAFVESRPGEAERRAAETVIAVARQTGAPLHVVHLGSGAALDLLVEARRGGAAVTAETCPHYLAFTQEDFGRLGSRLKTAPPVKEEADRRRLWQGVENGDIAFIATDHAAGQWPAEKETGSFWTDYCGVPGVELLLPWMLQEGVGAGRITLERLVELLCSAPARFFGISGRKGALEEGLDADFVVLAEDEPWTVRSSALHCLNRYTPFEGVELQTRVGQTWVRGELVYSAADDAFPAGPGWGVFVPREVRCNG